MNYLSYKGYYGSIEPELEDDTLHGKVLYIRDLLLFKGNDIKSLRQDFESLIDEYLEDCQALGKEPDKPFKGSFNVRIDPSLHQEAVFAAKGMSLNAFVAQAIKHEVERVALHNKRD